jgi:uncharacterized SAM-binding protein YcdF (DUF218 family)
MKRQSRRSIVVSSAALAVAAAFVFSFTFFVATVMEAAPAKGQKADGILVLTGGDRRLAAGMHLLESGQAKRLLVSGVNPDTSREMLRRAHNLRQVRLFACCTDLGYAASDTVGNASEARDWVQRQGYKSLIVVTANYHMPRSLAELGHAMPDVRLIAHPVDPRVDATGAWWTDGQMVRAMGREYLKYLRCTARVRGAHLVERIGGRATLAEKDTGRGRDGMTPAGGIGPI